MTLFQIDHAATALLWAVNLSEALTRAESDADRMAAMDGIVFWLQSGEFWIGKQPATSATGSPRLRLIDGGALNPTRRLRAVRNSTAA